MTQTTLSKIAASAPLRDAGFPCVAADLIDRRAPQDPRVPSLTVGDPALKHCMPIWGHMKVETGNHVANAPIGSRTAVLRSIQDAPDRSLRKTLTERNECARDADFVMGLLQKALGTA